MSAWDIYWLTRLEPLGIHLESVGKGLFILAVLCAFGFGVARGCEVDAETSDDNKAWSAAINRALKVFVLGAILSIGSCTTATLLPTKSDLAIIFAGAWATNSEEMQKLPDNVVGTLNKFMTDYIGDPDTKKEGP